MVFFFPLRPLQITLKTKFPFKSKLELFVVRKITVTFSKENIVSCLVVGIWRSKY